MRSLVLLAFVAVVDVRTADACAVAPPMGEAVRIAEEEALIVWDPATETEHFIRRAAFHSTARKFGFLVPTPAIPQLSEVPDSVFTTLAHAIQPEIKYVREARYKAGAFLLDSCLLAKSAGDKVTAGAPAPVRVLATANVAGFDATTVEADDANALSTWLGQHGFEVTPQLTKWLERYVAERWKLTAFVVAAEGDTGERYEMATKAVKMTFPAKRPFYPYREPQIEMTVETDAKLAPAAAARMLRVYFVSNARYAATLADQPWSAKVLQAGRLTSLTPELEAITGAQRYLSVFVDESSPRRGVEELYFAPSVDTADVKQPARVVNYPDDVLIPIDLLVLGALIAVFVVRRMRRQR